MRSILMVVADILGQQPLQVPLVQDNHVIEQVSSTTPDPTLRNPVLPRTAKGSADRLASHLFRERHHVAAKLRVSVEHKNRCAGTYGHASRICCAIQRVVGFRVTPQRRILRRSCPMTKKQYSTPKVSVGMVKKSMAAIASR